MTSTDKIDEMVRDFCSVVPKSKSEVRQRIVKSIHQAGQEMKDRCMRAIYNASPTIVGMRNDEAELWGKATTLFLDTLSSLNKPDKE